MEALWWQGEKRELSYKKDKKVSTIHSDEDVKIRVAYAGICGSDFHFMERESSKSGCKLDGVILGHEFSGVVVELGKAASGKLKIGDKVTVNPHGCCGKCKWSKTKEPQFCDNDVSVGVHVDGGWAQYCVAPVSKVHILPESIDLLHGALAEPFSCVLHGWRRLEPFPSKSCKVLVQGGGLIGILFCILLRHHNFTDVTVVERNNGRRKLCEGMQFGFNIIHPDDISNSVAEKDVCTSGYKVIFDSTGNSAAVGKAFEIACRGAKICVFGWCPKGEKILVDPFQIFWKELTVVGSFTSPFCFEDSIEILAKLALAGKLNYKQLGIKIFELNQFRDALACVKARKATKGIFKLC